MLALSEVEERREQLLQKRNASSIEDVQRKKAIRQKDEAQVVRGRANLSSFPELVTSVRAMRSGVLVSESTVDSIGDFELSVPSGRGM